MPLILPLPWPPSARVGEIDTRPAFDARLLTGSLAGTTVQGLRLDLDAPDLSTVDVTDALFVGCRFAGTAEIADVVSRGANVVPVFEQVPYPTTPAQLYTPRSLSAGFDQGGFEAMFDTVVHRHFVAAGGPLPGMREALAQRIHDAGIDDALGNATTAWIDRHGASTVVGVMGGHAVPRGAASYRMAATLARELARAGRLVVTGGGPGIMEAVNLGAYLSPYPADELRRAIDDLATSPSFTDHDPYTAAALRVRATYPAGPDGDLVRGGLSIPTWLYGHEPPNLFGSGIAKYFSNAIREDTLLRLARGGVVFAPGEAGTVQEVFQAVTKAFYAADGPSGPLVFLGASFWTDEVPVASLLRPLLARSEYDLGRLVHVTDDVSEAVGLLVGG